MSPRGLSALIQEKKHARQDLQCVSRAYLKNLIKLLCDSALQLAAQMDSKKLKRKEICLWGY